MLVMILKNTLLNIFKTLFFFDTAVLVINFLPTYSKGSAARSALVNEVFSLAVVLALTLIFFLPVERRQLAFFKPRHEGRRLFFGIVCGVLPLALCTGLLKLLHSLTFGSKANVSQLLFWVLALLANTLATELLLRGYLFRLYRKYYNVIVTAVLLTILSLSLEKELFAGGRLYAFNLAVFNLMLCLLVEATQSLLAAVIARFASNLLGALVLGAFSIAENYPAFFHISVSGKTWLTGGAHPITGGLVYLLLNGAICARLILLIQKRKIHSPSRRSKRRSI